MIRVLGRNTSLNVQAVMWCLAELGLQAERLDYGHIHGGTDTPDFRALNPNGLVPVLQDGDLVMWETGAILRYLAGRYGGGGFWPADPIARAPIDMWAEWGKVTLQLAFAGPIFWTVLRTAPEAIDRKALDAALDRFHGLLAILEAQIGRHPFVTGEDFTLADIAVGHVLYRYYTFDVPREVRPVVSAYYERLTERPGFREQVMINWEPLRIPVKL